MKKKAKTKPKKLTHVWVTRLVLNDILIAVFTSKSLAYRTIKAHNEGPNLPAYVSGTVKIYSE